LKIARVGTARSAPGMPQRKNQKNTPTKMTGG
jgi:hypothetical protein